MTTPNWASEEAKKIIIESPLGITEQDMINAATLHEKITKSLLKAKEDGYKEALADVRRLQGELLRKEAEDKDGIDN